MQQTRESGVSRRDFLKLSLTAVALGTLPAGGLSAAESSSKVKVWVFKGEDNRAIMRAALKMIAANGGFGDKFATMALKVNAGWERTPEQGANTHPELVDEFLKGVKAMGVKEVVLPEHSCNAAAKSFTLSGIKAAAESNGAKMVDLQGGYKGFKETPIPKGEKLKSALVAEEYLNADVVVNMPVAKHHGASQMSSAMKNWMGVIKDRGFWHSNNLHQCIADFCTFLQPRWTIIDATRCMLDKGPTGPTTNMLTPHELIVSRDQVAADAVASKFFKKSPSEIPYLAIAAKMGIGVIDADKIEIIRATV